jgi:hypothetical protein
LLTNATGELLRNICRERFVPIYGDDIDVIFGASLASTKLNEPSCNNNIKIIYRVYLDSINVLLSASLVSTKIPRWLIIELPTSRD